MSVGFFIEQSSSGQPIAHQLMGASSPNATPVISTAEIPGVAVVVVIGDMFSGADSLLRKSPAAAILTLLLGGFRNALDAIEGEYAFAACDVKQNRWILQRDPRGCWPLLYTLSPVIRISTHLAAFATTGRSWNSDAIAEYLTQPLPSDELLSRSAFLEGVFRVRPGERVEIDASDRTYSAARYWNWGQQAAAEQAVNTFDEAAVRLRVLLDESVKVRLRSHNKVAVHSSGGLDSSSILAIANKIRGPKRELHAVSAVYSRRSLTSERTYIKEMMAALPDVASQFVDGDHILYFDWFNGDLPFMDEPSSLLVSLPFQRALIKAAFQCGATLSLSGEGSDEVLRTIPYHICDALRKWRVLDVVRATARTATARNEPMHSILWRYAIKPLFPILTRGGIHWYLNNGYSPWPRTGLFSTPPWISRDFARNYDFPARQKAMSARMFGSPTAVSWLEYSLDSTCGDWYRWVLTDNANHRYGHPFRDPKVVRFALSLSGDMRDQDDKIKPLLTRAMGGDLPACIRTKRHSPGFDDIHGLGLRTHFDSLVTLIEGSELCGRGIFSSESLTSAMRSASLGIASLEACDHLDRSLSLLAWQSQFDDGARRLQWVQLPFT